MPTSPIGPSQVIGQACLLAREAAKQLESATEKLEQLGGSPGSTVPVRELRTAAGGGALDLDEAITGYVYFRSSWLRQHNLKSERCCIIGVVGESMEPTLFDGSVVLLDQDRQIRRVGGVFVVRGPDGLIVKRAAQDESGVWILTSDNQDWPSITWPDGAEIVGQVIWTAHELL